MSRFQLIVGNIGIVYDGDNEIHAKNQFNIYEYLSQERHGRYTGESVMLLKDDEILREHIGSQDESDSSD
jgi:hypothetical protein